MGWRAVAHIWRLRATPSRATINSEVWSQPKKVNVKFRLMSVFSLMSYKTSTLFHPQRASATVWITFCDKSQLITFPRLQCISCTIRLCVIWDSIQDASTFPVFYCHKRTSKHTQKVDTNLQLVEHWNLLESMNLWHYTFLILKCYPLLPSHRRSSSLFCCRRHHHHKWKCWNVENLFSNSSKEVELKMGWGEGKKGQMKCRSIVIECETEIVNWKMSRMWWCSLRVGCDTRDCVLFVDVTKKTNGVGKGRIEGYSVKKIWEISFNHTHFYSVLTFLLTSNLSRRQQHRNYWRMRSLSNRTLIIINILKILTLHSDRFSFLSEDGEWLRDRGGRRDKETTEQQRRQKIKFKLGQRKSVYTTAVEKNEREKVVKEMKTSNLRFCYRHMMMMTMSNNFEFSLFFPNNFYSSCSVQHCASESKWQQVMLTKVDLMMMSNDVWVGRMDHKGRWCWNVCGDGGESANGIDLRLISRCSRTTSVTTVHAPPPPPRHRRSRIRQIIGSEHFLRS